MKLQLLKKVTNRMEITSKFTAETLTYDGVKLQEVLIEYLSNFTIGILDPDIAGKKPDRYISNLFLNRLGDFEKRYIILACDGDKTVGILIALPDDRQRLHIYSLHVAAGYRRQGVGSLLLSTCINDMYQNNTDEIILEVHADNTPAFNLYKKYGFKELQ